MHRIRTLGALQLLSPAGDVLAIGDKPCALLVLLASAGASGLPRKACRELLWEGASDANGSNSLRQAVFRVRRTLGAEALEDVGGNLFLRVPIAVDLAEVESLLHDNALPEALDRIAGPIGATLDLAGLSLRAWVSELRGRIERHIVHSLRQRWREARGGPAPERIQPLLSRARALVRDQDEVLWLQLELDACLGAVDAFNRHANELEAIHDRAPRGDGGDPVQRRIATLRTEAAQRDRERARPPAAPLHPEPLALLEQTWQRCRRTGQPPVWVDGAAGTGRTWLLREFARRIALDGGRTAMILADPAAQSAPSACLRDITVALQGLRGAAGVDPKYAATLQRLQEGALGVPAHATDAVRDILSAVCHDGPLAILVDDAHHYHASALPPLLRSVSDGTIRGLVVVIAARTDTHAIPAQAVHLHLGPTDHDGLRALLGGMARLPRADWVLPVVEALHAATGGVPGPAVEAIVHLHGDGLLSVEDDRWVLKTPLAEVQRRLSVPAR